ncbi:hypothetical protein [Terrihabitans sp. B22-R8]|uniref:hypothetical protein n=1 Tax=Terrihabitans sp. B22-R8 TaxID=3425128 RepID=UPI00403C5268
MQVILHIIIGIMPFMGMPPIMFIGIIPPIIMFMGIIACIALFMIVLRSWVSVNAPPRSLKGVLGP